MSGLPNLAGLNLPPIPNPAAGLGAPNPLLQIVQALGQFPQQQLAYQGEKAQVEGQNEQLNQKRLAMIQQQLEANPALARQPGYVNTVKNLFKSMGTPAPLTADGAIDVEALTPTQDFQSLVEKDPNFLSTFMQADPTTKKALAKSMRIRNIDPQLLDLPPQYQMSPLERNTIRRGLMTEMQGLAQGNLTIPQFSSFVEQNKELMVQLGMHPDELLQMDPSILGKLSATTQAKIQQMQDLGILRKDQAIKAIADVGSMQSLADLRKAQAKWYGEKTAVLPQQLALAWKRYQTQTDLAMMRMQQSAERTKGYLSSLNRSNFGNLIRARHELLSDLNSARTAYATEQRIAASYANQDNPVPDDVIARLAQLKQQLDTAQSLAGQLTSPQAETQLWQKALQSGGLQGKVLNVTPPKAPYKESDVVRRGKDSATGRTVLQLKNGQVIFDDGTPYTGTP